MCWYCDKPNSVRATGARPFCDKHFDEVDKYNKKVNNATEEEAEEENEEENDL